MNKNKIILSILLLAVISYTNGCLMGKANYTTIKYYGLQNYKQILPADTIIKIANVSMIGSTGTKMTFKTGTCRILVDEYHRWINVPATMITVALQSSFSRTTETLPVDATEYSVTVTIFEFMADIEGKKAILGINYQISNKSAIQGEDSVTFSIPLKSVDPDNYAIAMSKAVKQLATCINKTIATIKANK